MKMPHRYWTLGFVSGPENTANNAAMLEAGLTCRLHVVRAAETGAARDEVHQGRRDAPALRCAPLPPRLEPRPIVQPSVPERPLCLTCRGQSELSSCAPSAMLHQAGQAVWYSMRRCLPKKPILSQIPLSLQRTEWLWKTLCKLPSIQSHAPAHAKGGRHAYQGQPQAQRRRGWPQKLPQPPGVHRCLLACTPHSWPLPQPQIPAALIRQPQPDCLGIVSVLNRPNDGCNARKCSQHRAVQETSRDSDS